MMIKFIGTLVTALAVLAMHTCVLITMMTVFLLSLRKLRRRYMLQMLE